MKGGSVVEVDSKTPELADAPVLNMNADSLNLSGGSNISLKTNEQGGSLDAKIEGNLMLESGSTIQLNQGGGDHPKGLLGITAENITIETGGIIGD